MRKSVFILFLCICTLIVTGCAISVNSTKHNDQPEVACPFDMSRTDYTVIDQVYAEFSATYVLGIGGWKTKSRNAVEELIEMADMDKYEQVVNITTKTRINVIVCGIVVRRVTSATGTLIRINGNAEHPRHLEEVNTHAKTTEKQESAPQCTSSKAHEIATNTNDDSINEQGDFVDLGLSVKWCTKNVGAKKETDYGSYIAWGELEEKESYSLVNYKYCEGTSKTFTKYCSNEKFGVVDYKDMLSTQDDVAIKESKGKYRIPTNDEWKELCEKCQWIWMKRDGIKGYQIKSRVNSNEIFLPASGFLYESTKYNIGINGYYWSSELNTDKKANCLVFNSRKYSFTPQPRESGNTIRPVFED